MAYYLEAPNRYVGAPMRSLFLAGGISNCPNWQLPLADALSVYDILIVNPRRSIFDVNDKSASDIQINWEIDHLEAADIISFWFPMETLCPIVLYELGCYSRIPDKPIFVGVHPKYQRLEDVAIQTKRRRPEVQVVNSLPALQLQLIRYLESLSL